MICRFTTDDLACILHQPKARQAYAASLHAEWSKQSDKWTRQQEDEEPPQYRQGVRVSTS